MRTALCLALLFLFLSLDDRSENTTANDLLFENSDFEMGTLSNWTAQGDAFRNQPVFGDNTSVRQREPSNHQGSYWIGTYEKYQGRHNDKPGSIQGDEPTGTLTSIPFFIRKHLISFLIGGGQYPEGVYVALIVNGQEVRKAVGRSFETMDVCIWDVTKWLGQSGVIIIKDEISAAESWGHINADYFHYLTFE